jgi:hypothetical protein
MQSGSCKQVSTLLLVVLSMTPCMCLAWSAEQGPLEELGAEKQVPDRWKDFNAGRRWLVVRLDRTETEYHVVFWEHLRPAEKSRDCGVSVFLKKDGGRFQNLCEFVLKDEALDEGSCSVDMDGDGAEELMLLGCVGASAGSSVHVLAFNNGTLHDLMPPDVTGSKIEIHSTTGTAGKQVIVYPRAANGSRGFARLYSRRDAEPTYCVDFSDVYADFYLREEKRVRKLAEEASTPRMQAGLLFEIAYFEEERAKWHWNKARALYGQVVKQYEASADESDALLKQLKQKRDSMKAPSSEPNPKPSQK